MKQVTFQDIYTLGRIIMENDLYRHFHYPEMLSRYDSNFLEFKSFPSLEEFEAAIAYLKEFHFKKGQKHVKFVFPPNEKLTAEVFFYLLEQGFSMGLMELYTIDPGNFPDVKDNPDIEIQPVTRENFETYLQFQYQQDIEFGKEFADQKVFLHGRHFEAEHVQQVLAFYKGKAAGSVDIIINDDTAEIDGLTVSERYRRKGVGSSIQKFVMDRFPEKTVILVADGEDTPKEMYKKQNYQYAGFRHEVQKIYEE